MRGIGAGTRVFSLLARDPIIPPPDVGVAIQPGRRGVLRYENVSFAYPTRPEAPILQDFSLEIGVGESVAIVYVGIRLSLSLLTYTSQRQEWHWQVEHPVTAAPLLRSSAWKDHVRWPRQVTSVRYLVLLLTIHCRHPRFLDRQLAQYDRTGATRPRSFYWHCCR